MLEDLIDYLHQHNIQIVKDIIIPSLGLDKILSIVAIYYVAKSFMASYKLNRVNLIYQLTQSHRDIWKNIHDSNTDGNILSATANPLEMTNLEKRHIIYLILNIETSFEAHKSKICILDKSEIIDIGNFMNLPLLNHVWERTRELRNRKFVYFINMAKHLSNPADNPRPKGKIKLAFVKLLRIIRIITDKIGLKFNRFRSYLQNISFRRRH